MCPLRLLPKLFLYDEDELPAELRAQRPLNRSRIPGIARYILENREEYVFSSITASVDGAVSFQPVQPESDLGTLNISMTSKFIINDGQHRRVEINVANEFISARPARFERDEEAIHRSSGGNGGLPHLSGKSGC